MKLRLTQYCVYSNFVVHSGTARVAAIEAGVAAFLADQLEGAAAGAGGKRAQRSYLKNNNSMRVNPWNDHEYASLRLRYFLP